MAVLTNNDMPVKISASDRRYMVCDGNDSLKGNKAFFADWYKNLAPEPKFQRAVYDFLMQQNVENFDWDKGRPLTEGHREIQHRSMPKDLKFIIHFVTDGWGYEFENVPIEGANLFRLFEAFCGPSQLVQTPTAGGFGSKLRNTLKKLNLFSDGDQPENAFHKRINNNGCTVWHINRRAAFEGIKSQKFTEYDTFDSLPSGISYYSSMNLDGSGNQFHANRIKGTLV